jgi:hypothetical protein
VLKVLEQQEGENRELLEQLQGLEGRLGAVESEVG